MQEESLYDAVLVELTDEELVTVFGRALKRRGRSGMGLVLGGPGEHTLAATTFPDDTDMRLLPLASQLRVLSVLCGDAVSEECTPVEREVEES